MTVTERGEDCDIERAPTALIVCRVGSAGLSRSVHGDLGGWLSMALPAVFWSGLMTSGRRHLQHRRVGSGPVLQLHDDRDADRALGRHRLDRETQPGGGGIAVLNSVTATSSTNAWAVGSDLVSNGSAQTLLPVIERWDGTSWTVATTAPSFPSDTELLGVTATSATDASAVGDTGPLGSVTALAEHWNGTAWSVAPGSGGGTALSSVAAISPTSALAAGVSVSTGESTLAERWDGTSWTTVPSATPAPISVLASVAATSAASWAVGFTAADGGMFTPTFQLIGRFNGSAWTAFSPTPSLPSGSQLTGVAVTSAKNAWAVGVTTLTDVTTDEGSLIEHWKGQRGTSRPART